MNPIRRSIEFVPGSANDGFTNRHVGDRVVIREGRHPAVSVAGSHSFAVTLARKYGIPQVSRNRWSNEGYWLNVNIFPPTADSAGGDAHAL